MNEVHPEENVSLDGQIRVRSADKLGMKDESGGASHSI
jgi:hypothetical protein